MTFSNVNECKEWYRDIAVYNKEDLKEEPEDGRMEVASWRCPRLAGLLAPLLGTGMQLLVAMAALVSLSMLVF